MEIPIVQDIVIILALAVGVLLLCHRLRIPGIVGFLFTGVVCGPHGLGLVQNLKNVELLAEVGVILLLFSIGMHFSLRKLFDLKRFFFVGGPLQVILTSFAGFSIGYLTGRPIGESIFLGWLLSLSSTAIVLNLLEKKKELATPHGHIITSILIFQDVIAVIMILLTSFLTGEKPIVFSHAIYWELGKGILLIGGVALAAEKVVPWLLFHVTRTQIKELFLLTVLTLCILVAWITSTMGLSLSIGAFLAGLTISETEYSHEAIGDILPFKALFTSFFFVSIGMLLELSYLYKEPVMIAFLTVGVLLMKAVLAGVATLLLGIPIRIAAQVGIILAQVGEFSFVLAQTGMREEIATPEHYQIFLAVAIITMTVSPFLIEVSRRLAGKIARWPWPEVLQKGLISLPTPPQTQLTDHVIIVGYGLCGQYLARSCRVAGTPYAVLELDPHIVRKEKLKGEPLFYGDATHESVLMSVNIDEARVVAVVINDVGAAQRIVHVSRLMNPSVFIIIRTQSLQKMAHFLKLGADVVVPDEFGSSIEIFSRVMQHCHIPNEEIQHFIQEVREEGYESIHQTHYQTVPLREWRSSSKDLEIGSYRVSGNSILVGKKLEELAVRNTYGITVLMIKRGNEVISDISGESFIEEKDVLVVLGRANQLSEFSRVAKGIS